MLDPSNPTARARHGDANKSPARGGAGPQGPGGSAAEQGARNDPVLGDEFGGRDVLTVLVLRLDYLDPPALGGHEEALRAVFGDLADLALYRAESTDEVLAAVEDLQLFAADRRPSARRRVAAADEVVSEINVVRPVDLRLRRAAPALVARKGFVLHGLLVLARDDEVRGFEHRLHAHGEEPVEVDAPQCIVGADRCLL